MRRLPKALVAVAAGVALLVLNSVPSAASQTVELTGTIVVNLIPTMTVPVGTSTDPNCVSEIDVHWDSTTAWTDGHASITLVVPFDLGGNYLLELSYSSMDVDSLYIPTGPYASKWYLDTAGFVATAVNFYPSTGTGSCTRSSTTPKCSNVDVGFSNGLDALLTPNGTLGTDHVVPVSSTIDLDAVGAIAAAGCTPPFSILNGKTATLTGLTGHFAT